MADDKTITANADDAQRYWLEEGYSEGGVIREVDYAANSKGIHPSLAGIKIVDCDTHFTEPKDLWTANAPAGLKDKIASEDDERRGQDEIQKLTDKFVADIDKMVTDKEKEVMTV